MKEYKFDTVNCFCGQIVNEVEHWQSDVFITYDQIKSMELDREALVITRKNGCEFIDERTSEPRIMFDSWKKQGLHFYLIKRTEDGRREAVEYREVTEDEASQKVEKWNHDRLLTHWYVDKQTNAGHSYVEMVSLYHLESCCTLDIFSHLEELVSSDGDYFLSFEWNGIPCF